MTATCITVQLGAHLFDGDTIDADSVKWTAVSWDGWESPDTRQQWHEPAGQSGVVPGVQNYGGRAIVLKGTAEVMAAPWEQGYEKAERRLAGITNLVESGPGLLIINHLPTPMQALVYRAGRLRHRRRIRSKILDWEVPLFAADHRKYGTSPVAGGAGVLANAGNTRATPIVTVTGPAAGPIRVTNATDDAKFVEVTTALAGGQVLTIDMNLWTASINGVNVDNLIAPASRWWDLRPGNNTISQSGGGTLNVAYRPAYI